MRKHGSRRLIAAISMVVAMALFLPGLGLSGSLEPSGPPEPTMRTLDEIYSTNSWSKKLQCDQVETIHGLRNICPRFEVLADFNNEAVLDKETGLVWEKSPSYSYGPISLFVAQGACNNNAATHPALLRFGWRLPTAQELESLIDPTTFTLPTGNPFSNLMISQGSDEYYYWTATSVLGQTDSAWVVSLGPVGYPANVRQVNQNHYVWCVRGGSGVDAQ
jgi:hypothetical protein